MKLQKQHVNTNHVKLTQLFCYLISHRSSELGASKTQYPYYSKSAYRNHTHSLLICQKLHICTVTTH